MKCMIVMYHYVRELEDTRYPQIKGLRTSLFREQLAYLAKYYTFVRAEDLIAAVWQGESLPERAVWLTFDDAYADHYENVFPILDEMGIQGAFFAPVKAIRNHEVLDVNKIHFVLASVKDVQALVGEVDDMIDENREKYELLPTAAYHKIYAKPSRFDPAEVIYVKRMLQVALPEALRRQMADRLFRNYVSENEAAFSRELYMNEDQMRCMLRHGMFFGSHGYDHYWLDSLPPEKQASEVDASLSFLKQLGCDMRQWVMNYPYGGYNDSLIQIIKERGCKLALTTKPEEAELSIASAYQLPRLDTNDLPKNRQAACPF